MSSQAPPLPAPDFFAYRRELAGIPDYPRRLLYEALRLPGERSPVLPIELEGIGTVEHEQCPRGIERVRVWLDVPPPRPMRPALDGEAP